MNSKAQVEPGSRTVEAEVEIQAPVDQVWKALTDADELTRWFPLSAKVVPGVGGQIVTRWGPEMEGTSRILEWEPERHLRTSWFEGPRDASPQPGPLMVDYQLEASGGKTTLRLVHSGFGADASWDEEYDGVSSGWAFELRSLRHYLENHLGKARQVVRARVPLTASKEEATERLWSKAALLAQGRRPKGGDGDPYTMTLATGEVLDGRILYDGPGAHFGGTVDSMDRALFRAMIENCGAGVEASLWLSSWSMNASEAAEIEQRWTTMLKDAGC